MTLSHQEANCWCLSGLPGAEIDEMDREALRLIPGGKVVFSSTQLGPSLRRPPVFSSADPTPGHSHNATNIFFSFPSKRKSIAATLFILCANNALN
ncbi:hypothetical protein AAFF_G00132520 [Aldrovandia affinis]|uniref:Uncharacterized protein n=1 Tax=Aldrovandia affinis TaxID=143900 RepID=A0AAD7RQG6_9TELE|nr:hypothetical protein AAFF_G00132520 [Aldrovandia affinis]